VGGACKSFLRGPNFLGVFEKPDLSAGS